MEYVVGAGGLPACSVGAPHIRQRLWWVADSGGEGLEGRQRGVCKTRAKRQVGLQASGNSAVDWTRSVWWPCRDGKWRRVPGRVGNSGGSNVTTQGHGREEHQQDNGPAIRNVTGTTEQTIGLGNVPSGGCGVGGDAALMRGGRCADGAEQDGGVSDTELRRPNCDDPNNATRKSGQYQSLTRTAMDFQPIWATAPRGTCFRLPDMTGWKLNPRFSLWLMGYPGEWASCGVRAMQSCHKSRRSSSGRTAAAGHDN
jgi:hypothetical protein